MDYSNYFKHVLGLTGLMVWLKRWERFEGAPFFKENELYLGQIASQRIGFGIPKNRKYGKTPFLAFQKEERQWMELIPWSRSFIILEKNVLVFVSSKTIGDGENLGDLPSFALAIPFDQNEKLQMIQKNGNISFRGLWFDEDADLAQILLESGPAWKTLKVTTQDADQPMLSEKEISHGVSFDELLMKKLQNSNRETNPGYLGNPMAVSQEFKDLVGGFDPKKIQKVTNKQTGV